MRSARALALSLVMLLAFQTAAEAGLKINLRFADGTTSHPLTIGDIGSEIPIQIWATITPAGGVNGSGAFAGFHFANLSIASARVLAGPNGSIDGGLAAPSLIAPFNQDGNQFGDLATLTDDGIADLGSSAAIANADFVQPRALIPIFSDNPEATGQPIAGGGYEFLVGTVNFLVAGVPGGPAVGAATRFDALIPNWAGDNALRANWYQQSDQTPSDGLNNGAYAAGDAVLFVARAASEWILNGDGAWSNAANWNPGQPNAKSAVVNFRQAASQPVAVTLDVDKQAGIVNFDSLQSFTLTGAGSLTLNPSGFDAQINVLRGNHTIAAPLVPIRSTTIRVDADSQLHLTNLQSLAPVIRKTGSGELTVGPATYNNNLFLSVFDGTLKLTTDAGEAGISNLQLQGELPGAKIVFQAPQHIASLTLRFGAVAENQDHYLHFRSMDIAADAGAVLDIGAGAMAVTYQSGNPPLTKFRDLIKSGMNIDGAIWEGSGITSSAARNDPLGVTTIGYGDNLDMQYTHVDGVHFNYDGMGEATPTRAILVKYTYIGDADLNGVVDGDDLVAFLVGYANPGLSSHWSAGDFDYNEMIDGDDLTALLVGYAQQGAPLGVTARVAAVPEPASWLLGLAGLAALGRFGRNRARPA